MSTGRLGEAVPLLHRLCGDTEFRADPCPRQPGLACRADRIGDLAFGTRSGDHGATQQVLRHVDVDTGRRIELFETLRQLVGVVENLLD